MINSILSKKIIKSKPLKTAYSNNSMGFFDTILHNEITELRQWFINTNN